MNLIPWRRKNDIPVSREANLQPSMEFRREIDRLFESFFHNSWMEPQGRFANPSWPTENVMPSVDVSENKKEITIRVEVPGMTPEDIDVNVVGNMLTIHGVKDEETKDEGDDRYHCERRFGSFSRTIELPTTASLEDIAAVQSNGVLTVTVAKLPARQTKTVDVKSLETAGMAGTRQ